MENRDQAIRDLFARLDQLTRQQKLFHEEIHTIRQELQKLTAEPTRDAPAPAPLSNPTQKREAETTVSVIESTSLRRPEPVTKKAGTSRTAWEEFIGTNLLNKIGIAILVLGIGLGAKYSIDHGMLTAQTRILLGYASGLMLVGLGYWLRRTHTAFSTVLFSGGMAVLYFITFAAYSFYDLIPQVTAFALMVVFTIFTVIGAMRYNYESVGIIGLVGAYAVPLLLSDGSGRVLILFSYVTIINAGILFLSFRKDWKALYYSAFILTWLTFASWYTFSFDPDEHVTTALVFSAIFFITFLTTFVAYKVVKNQSLARWDIASMLMNSFLFFGYGYLTVESLEGGEAYLGLFTLVIAVVHLLACFILYRTIARYSDSFYFIAGMVLVFVTMAVPVQLEGNWVTFVWSLEAVLLFWMGRTKSLAAYEKTSYPVMLLAFLSLVHDWGQAYPPVYAYSLNENFDQTMFLNIVFATSMIVGISFVTILMLRDRYPDSQVYSKHPAMKQIVSGGIPVMTVFIFYVGIFKEIEAFWNIEYVRSGVVSESSAGNEYIRYNESLPNFKQVWLIIYSALFALVFFVIQWRRRTIASVSASMAMNVLIIVVFITAGLVALASLRTDYLHQELAGPYERGIGYIAIRYPAVLLMLALLVAGHKMINLAYFNQRARDGYTLVIHLVVLVLLSSELIHWCDMAGVKNSFRLVLSILWGAYALFLVVLGVSKDLRHVRLGGIVLFAVTLLKLFIYDMEDMSTIAKTIVMIILGVLLLTASFVYNKYKRTVRNEAP